MKFGRLIFAGILCSLIFNLGLALHAAEPFLEKIDLYEGGKGGHDLYRIPGIVVTSKGTALAYCEARSDRRSDWGEIEIHLRRSTDGGKTWSPTRQIAHFGPRIEGNPRKKTGGEHEQTVNNPVAIVDHKTGAVHFLYCINYAHCFYMSSDDDGLTFSKPVEITQAFEGFRPKCNWKVLATGPGHGIQLENGRLVVPIWLAYGKTGDHSPSMAGTIYSDDHGQTWHAGDIALPNTPEYINPNETSAVQLADGRVLLNNRNVSKPNRKLVTTSKDGATGWSKPVFDKALWEPVCMASICRLSMKPADDKNRILFSNPYTLPLDKEGKEIPAGRGKRQNLSIKLSYNEAKTWPVNKTLEAGPSAYSDLAVLPDGTILCFYERDKRITIARFNLEWLTDGKDAFKPFASAKADTYRIPATPFPLLKTMTVNGIEISPEHPPKGLVIRQPLGLLCVKSLNGQVIHRSSRHVFESRATITPKGDYLLMFPEGEHYGGSHGKKVNNMIAYRSSDKGRTWQGPTFAFDINYSQHGFIPLIPKGSKRIYAFGTQPIPTAYSWENGQAENTPIGYRWSDDDGHTWSDVTLIHPVNDPEFKGMSVMRMCETDAGTWILGSHNADWSQKPLQTRQYLLRSEDQGKTWTVLPDKRPNGWFVKSYGRMDEGRPINLGHGKVLTMIRTPEGHLWTTRSTDDGKTWSTPVASPLIHPDAPPMLFHLSDGKTLVAFHHNRHAATTYKGLTAKMEGMKDRSEIWVSTSRDEGRTWSEPRFLFATAAGADLENAWFNYQCSYMDAIMDHGTIHLFVPHRWQQVLHLTIKESALKKLPTKMELQAAAHQGH